MGQRDGQSRTGDSRQSLRPGLDTKNSPVEMSRSAIPQSPPFVPGASAIRYVAADEGSIAGSIRSGRDYRTTSRFTSPFAVFGSSVCSQIATL